MKVLIAVDFTQIGRKAAEYGYRIALKNGLDAVFFNCVPKAADFFSGYDPKAFLGTTGKIEQKKVNQEAKKNLDDLIAVIVDTFGKPGNFAIEEEIKSGDPADEILKYAKAKDVGMIVVGYKSHSGISELLVGSTAAKIARYAPCSVLIYRPTKDAPVGM